MARHPTGSIRLQLPSSSVVSGTTSLAKAAQTHLQAQRSPSRQEQQIGNKTRQHLAKQIGYAMKGEHAQHMIEILDERTIERWSDFLAHDRALRNQARDLADQADFEYFAQLIRQAHGNSLLTARTAAVEQIEQTITESLEPEDERRPHYVVEYDPGLVGRLVGGQRVTKVLYDGYDSD